MSWQTYVDGSAANAVSQQGLGQRTYEHQQAQFYAPPDMLLSTDYGATERSLALSQNTDQQQSEYDPFSHCEYQPGAPPIPADDAPPPLPPAEDAPPLPEDMPPPLPPQAAFPQDQYEQPTEQSQEAAPQYQEPPVHDGQTDSRKAWQAQQYLGHTISQTPTQPPEPAYQYPAAAYSYGAPQQSDWQQYHQSQPYAGYAQPQMLHQQPPWQAQALPQPQAYWQQSELGQPQYQIGPYQTPAPPQPLPQPQPVVLPVPEEPAAAPQAAPRVVTDSKGLFLKPGRSQRPKRVAIILRGLPGSGKSHLAKKMKDVEVEQGGEAPRIHAIDDYFVTEVEKEEIQDVPGKKSRKRTIREMEYCYESELEGTYKASLLRAYEKTVREGRFALVIVDAPNLYAEDLKPYWTAGQRGSYEVYIAELETSDAEACHERNIHNRSLADVQQAAAAWQDTPAVYPLLELQGLLGGSAKAAQAGIAEVEMEDDSDAGASDSEAAAQPVSSKWTSQEATPLSKKKSKRSLAQGQGTTKRAKAEAALLENSNDFDGLTAGLDGFFGKKQKQGSKGLIDNASTTRGVLKKALLHLVREVCTQAGAAGRGQSVRWADEAPAAESGFRIGGSQQLETIYVLEGLGPPKEHAQSSKSFKDQIRAEHHAERTAFREVMLGGRRA